MVDDLVNGERPMSPRLILCMNDIRWTRGGGGVGE